MRFDDDLEIDSAMVIFAHPDDAEWTCGGTIAKWAREGVECTYVLVTNGGSGTQDVTMTRERLTEIRYREQQEAADVLGVKNLVKLGFEDGYLYPDLDLRRAIAREIRRFRPDVVITQDPRARTVADFYINHPDHIAVGECVFRSMNPDASSALMFPELLHDEGLEQHLPKALFLGAFLEGTTFVDVSDTFELKIEALLKHASQMDEPDGVAQWARERFKQLGERAGFTYAEGFHRFALGD